MKFDALDWCMVVFLGVGSVMLQQLRFMAMRYDEPAKLSLYQYLVTIYQLFYDIFIFDQTYSVLQWVGFSILFAGYSWKFSGLCLNKSKSTNTEKLR